MPEAMLRGCAVVPATAPVEASTLFLDMDSFFASVEQQYNPGLRGRPVGVCPCLGDGCCVVAASREAKLCGVRTGVRVRDARRLCPDIVLISDSPTSYREVHTSFMKILDNTVCRVQSKGIDEAWMKLPWYLVGSKDAHDLARQVKAQISDTVGPYISCSIGIAPNIWLGKMAASHRKPNGLVELRTSDLEAFYKELRLVDLNGISWRLARQCYRLGIYSPIALYQAPLALLRRAWGVNGVKWYLRMRGYEVDISTEKPQKTLSHQTTLMPNPAMNIKDVTAVLTKMSFRIGRRLRANHQMAKGVSLYLRYIDHSHFVQNLNTGQAFASNDWILRHLKSLLPPAARLQPVKQLSIGLYDLTNELQLSLGIDLATESDRTAAVSMAIDRLNTKHGTHTIIPASSLGRDIFPDRIGFGNSRALI